MSQNSFSNPLTNYFGGSQAPSLPSSFSDVPNSITSVQNYVNGVGSKYILNPHGMKGIAGFVFDYEGDDQISLESDITDHFAENNSSVQDHIALKPYRIVLRGFVSELFLPGTNTGLFGALTTLQSKMGTVNAYLGRYTPQALQTLQGSLSKAASTVQNYANTAAQYLNQAKNLASFFPVGGKVTINENGVVTTTGILTRQQSAFVALASLRDTRQIFNVLTPWTLIEGMAIESLVFIQSKESKSKSDIAVTMKQMRFVDIQSSPNVMANTLGRANFQNQGPINLGSTAGTPVTFPAVTFNFVNPSGTP